MSAVVKTKCSALGAYSVSLCKTFFHKEGRVRVHIATALSADWMEGVLKPFVARKVYYSFLSVWQQYHVFFSPLVNSAVFGQFERLKQQSKQKGVGATKKGTKVLLFDKNIPMNLF